MAVMEKLIEAVKNHPILYDFADEDYRNIRKRDQIWQQIGIELGQNEQEVKEQWSNLREKYENHLEISKTTSSQSVQLKQMETYSLSMSYAKTNPNIRDNMEDENSDSEANMRSPSPSSSIQQNERTSDIESNDASQKSEGSASSAITSVSMSKDTDAAIPNKRIKTTEQESAAAAVIQYLKEIPKCNHNESNMDTIELIFSAYAKTVKMFSPQLQVTAKLKFAEVMSYLELEQQQDRGSVLTSHSSIRPSSSVNNATGSTTPVISETRDSQYTQGATSSASKFQDPGNSNVSQIASAGTSALQKNYNFNKEEAALVPFYNRPYAADSQIRQSNYYQTNQSGTASSSLRSYVSYYNPNEIVNNYSN